MAKKKDDTKDIGSDETPVEEKLVEETPAPAEEEPVRFNPGHVTGKAT